MNPKLLVVGSVAIDTIETIKGVRERILGGSASYFSLSASIFTKVGLVGIVGEDFPKDYILLFQKRGVDISGLRVGKGKSFFWHGRYSEDFSSRTTIETQLNLFAQFSPELPEEYREVNYLFLGNIHPRLQLSVLEQVSPSAFVAADTMNYWIEGERELLKEVLKKVDLFFINDEEVRLLTGEISLIRGAKKILELGPLNVIVKKGEHGAFVLNKNNGIFFVPAYPVEEVVDPTGAGDSFAGGVLGYLATKGKEISFEDIKLGMVYGTIVASYTVEGFGVEKLLSLEHISMLNLRAQRLKEMTLFPKELISC